MTFKTNVTRQRSKRWVEAKAGVYDGGGWGDDDYDDYDDEPYPPPPPPLPQGTGSAGPRRRSSFDRGDDGLSPTTGGRGNGFAVPRIEATEVEIVPSLPPTPLELEQRERALRGQYPSYTQQQYPMQPRPQLPKIPYINAPTSSGPARTPPLPSQAALGSSYSNSKVLPRPPSIDEIPPPPVKKDFPVRQPNEIGSAPGVQIRDKVPPQLGAFPVTSTPAPPPPPPPPPPKPTSAGGMESPPVAKPTRYSPSPPLVEGTSASGQSYGPAGAQEPPSFSREGLPALESAPAVSIQPNPVPTPSQLPPPSPPPAPPPPPVEPPPVEPEFMEMVQAQPPPALAEDVDTQTPHFSLMPPKEDTAISVISDDNGSLEPSDWSQGGQDYDDSETEEQQPGHVGTDQVHHPSYFPQTDHIASFHPPVDPSEQSTSPEEVVTPTNRENDRSHESDWQYIGGDAYPGTVIMDSQGGGVPLSTGGEGHLNAAQNANMALLSGSESVEPFHEPGEHLGSLGSRLSDGGDEKPTSPAGSRPASRQGRSPTGSHPLQTEALADDSSTTAVVRTPPHQFDPTAATGEEKDQTGRYSYWNDDIISGYATNSPDGPQSSAPFHEPPQQAYAGGVSSPPTLMTSLPTPDLGKKFPPFEPQRPENLGFRSMVNHAFSGQDALVPTPVTPNKDLTYAPGYIISPILPREIPLPKSPSPPIVRAPVAPPKSPSPPLLSTPTPPSKSLTPPGRQGTPSLASNRDQVGSSSPRNSIGPERTATPVFPPVAIHGISAELDQVPSDPVVFKDRSPAPRDGAPSSQLSSYRGPAGGSDRAGPEVENVHLSGPQAQSMAPQKSQSQESETRPLSFRGPDHKRESAGGLSLYDSYWTEQEAAPPPIQPKSPWRPSASFDTEVVRHELDLLARQNVGPGLNSQTPAPPQPAVSSPSPEKIRSGAILPPVAIPDSKLPSDPLLMTPASALGTPGSELVEMDLARRHYLARTQTGLSARSDSLGQRGSDEDVMLRVKGDERMSWKPGNTAAPAAEPNDREREAAIGPGGEAGPQVKRSDDITPTRVIGPDSEGIEAIGGPTAVPRKVPPEGEDNDGERTPLQSDFARELVNQFSRPQTLMLKDTMPMPAGLMLMPPMPPKAEGEERSPEVVDFSKDGDEEDDDVETPDAVQANLTSSDKLPQEGGPKAVDVGKANHYMEPQDIMKLAHSHERAAAYNQASKAIAQADTGLGSWISWMMKENGGGDLLKTETGQGPVSTASSLGKSASPDLGGGVLAEGVGPRPNQPPAAHSHQTNAGWPPQNLGTPTGDHSQVPGASAGPHVGPVVDKAKGFFTRFSKKGHKDAQDASSLSPAQRGSPSSTPGTSLRTLASSGSFQNSFTAAGLVGAHPPNGNHKQGPQAQSVPHLQGQPVHQPGSGLPHSHGFQTQQPLRQSHEYEPVTNPSSDQQRLSREQGLGQGQGQGGSQPLQGEQFYQGPIGQASQQGPPQPPSAPIPPQPPAKDRPPQLIIPGQHQQIIAQGHPAGHVQNMPDQGFPPHQQDPQTTGAPPPETGQWAPRSHMSQESTVPSQPPPATASSVGRTTENQKPPPPPAQHSFPRRTDSLLSRSQRQQSTRASLIPAAQIPARADSLAAAQDPKHLQQQVIISDDIAAPVQPPGQAGHSSLVSSSIVNSSAHSGESGPPSSYTGHGQHQKKNSFAWAPKPQTFVEEEGQQQYQGGGQNDQSQFHSAQRPSAQEPNSVARSHSSRLPLHSDGYTSHDQASVGRSQSYHLGGYASGGNQQQGSAYGRRGAHPEPIHENPPTPRKLDDSEFYAPPPGIRIPDHSTPGNFGSPGPLPRASEQTSSAHPRQDTQSQQPRQPGGTPDHANQAPRQTSPIPDYRITLPDRQYPTPDSNQSKQAGVPNYPDPYNPAFQPRITGYQPLPQQALQQGHFRKVSAGAVAAPGSFPPQQSYQPEPDRRNSSGLAKTMSNASGNRQSTDTGSFDPQGGNQYEPSTSSSQRRRSDFFSNLAAKVGDAGKPSPSQSVDPKVAGKPQKRGSSFLKLRKGDGSKDKKGDGSKDKKGEALKEKKNPGVVGGKPTHKKGFSDVFGRTSSMLGKALSKPSSPSQGQPPAPMQKYPSPPPQKYPSPPPQVYPSPPPQVYPSPSPQVYPSQPAPQQRQPQQIGPKQGQVGQQERGPDAANPNMYYYQPQKTLPPQGSSAGNWNNAQQQQQQRTFSLVTGTQSPPPVRTSDLSNQQAQPQTDSQQPRYDPVPMPTSYGRPQGEFQGAYTPGQQDNMPNQQPQQSQPAPPGQQVPTQADSSQSADGKAATEQVYNRPVSEQRPYRQSPDLSRPGTQASRAQGVSPSLSPPLSRQGTQASHTRSISPQISNIDAHSVRNAPMSSLSEGTTIAQTERAGSPAAQFRSPTQMSPRSSLRDSNQTQFVPSPTHTPPPQQIYSVASPHAAFQMENGATPQGAPMPLRGASLAPPVPAKVLPTPPSATPTPVVDQGPRPPVAGNTPQVPTPPPQRARSPTEGGKAKPPQTFFDDSGSSRANTPDRQKPVVADYSEEKIALEDGVEVEPTPRDDAEDVPVMSATAYPGQAWDPTSGW